MPDQTIQAILVKFSRMALDSLRIKPILHNKNIKYRKKIMFFWKKNDC